MGTGNDFGSIVIWNTGSTPCRIAGSVTFTAFYHDGRQDTNAHPNRPLRPVAVVLPANMPTYRDGADPAGYLTADLMGPERDDPNQPAALCRQQDKLAPAVLVLTLGKQTFRVPNLDPQSLQVKQVYGCHGRILLEQADRAA
jgi:hypothetical protein